MKTTYDVLIIGGGPAGLYAAYCLARGGRRVAVFEEHPEIGMPVHCTGLLTIEGFTRFTLPQGSIRGTWRRAAFRSPGGHLLSVASEQDQTVVVDRSAFDQGLADQAVAVGADLFLGHKVEALHYVRGGVIARTSIEGHGPRAMSGRLVIVATGAAYLLHRGLGLAPPPRFLQSAQVEVDFAQTEAVEVYFGSEVAPGSFAWIVPFNQEGIQKAKIGLLSSRDADEFLARFLQSSMVASRLLPGFPLRYRRRPVPIRPIPETFKERVLVIGDAAGIVKPTTGGGIYYSLLTAELAATTAMEALHVADYSAQFLSRYQAAWQKALASEIRMGALFRCYGSRLSDAQIDEAFRLVASEQVAHLIRDHAAFNWHSPIIRALWRSSSVRCFLWRSLVARGRQLTETGPRPSSISSGLDSFAKEALTV